MKKLLRMTILMTLVASMLVFAPLMAEAAKAGDTVSGSVKIAPGFKFNGYGVVFSLSDGLELVSASDTAGGSLVGTKIGNISVGGLDSVTVTVTAKVKAGTVTDQQIKFTTVEYSTLSPRQKYNDSAVTRTITIEGAATDAPTTTAPVTDAPTTTAPVTEVPVTAAPTAAPTPAPTWSPWKVRKAATCTAEGVEFRTMGTQEETRPIAKLAHKEGKWEVVRKATAEQPGLRVKKCTVGGEILKQEEIPFSKVQRFTNNTASSQGFYFRNEVKGLTKEWNMFTPIDVSADGEQNIPLIASNMYYIGNVKVVVAGDNVTVTYEVANGVKVRKDFLAILPDLASVKTIDPAKLADFAHAYGEPISIENDLKGDTKVLLYVRNNVDYADNFRGVTRFTNRLDAYTKVLDGLRAIMD